MYDDIDSDLLMIFDSNGQYMDAKKMQEDSQYVRAATIEEAITFFDNTKTIRQPTKVLINVGLNNVNSDNPSICDSTVYLYQRLMDKIRSTLPNSHVYISSIIHRKDDQFTSNIDTINKTLAKWDNNHTNLTFIHHTNIKNDDDMLYDTKHLNKRGFFGMVTNLKYVMYRTLPSFLSPTAVK